MIFSSFITCLLSFALFSCATPDKNVFEFEQNAIDKSFFANLYQEYGYNSFIRLSIVTYLDENNQEDIAVTLNDYFEFGVVSSDNITLVPKRDESRDGVLLENLSSLSTSNFYRSIGYRNINWDLSNLGQVKNYMPPTLR